MVSVYPNEEVRPIKVEEKKEPVDSEHTLPTPTPDQAFDLRDEIDNQYRDGTNI